MPLANGCGLFWTVACAMYCASPHAPFPIDFKYIVFESTLLDSYVLEQIVNLKDMVHSRASLVFEDSVVT